jgi:putative acyl-CoA dehydrogenase
MRAATVAAVHHASHRQAFGKDLVAQPLMTNVLADLALESQAATALAFRLAGAADRAAHGDAGEAALLRLALPAAKYWVCKRFPIHAAEALECLGGNGYVEESGLPRLYREAPLNSIWEGSGNVTALDVLRALTRTAGAGEALLAELDAAAGADARLGAAVASLRRLMSALETTTSLEAQHEARRLAGQIAVTLAAALLVRHAPAPVADAFCASRLEPGVPGGPGAPFGTLPARLDLMAIVDRARAGPPGVA